ncbi:hypothetical protein [Lysinibacillus sphaericus]|uniref:hypothetical protein n=1 Tax=Lysinibacillus sphaericus TaxID=1421 RepID=UPI0025A10EB6|nr:hypothetical protein [Lysinibacillus sphaericus]
MMELPVPRNNNTYAYEKFYYTYFESQIFQNYCYNILTLFENQFEMENDYDWDKQFPSNFFQVPFKQGLSNEGIDKIIVAKNEIKKKMHLSKDYYFLIEEFSKYEFLQLFSCLEHYLKEILIIIIKNKPDKFNKLHISRTNQKILIRKLRDKDLNDDEIDNIIKDAIKDYVSSMNVKQFLDDIIQSFSGKTIDKFKSEMPDYKRVISFIDKMRELRNLHIHHLGVGENGYERISGNDKIDTFRGMVINLIPLLDKMVEIE